MTPGIIVLQSYIYIYRYLSSRCYLDFGEDLESGTPNTVPYTTIGHSRNPEGGSAF